MAAGRAPEHMSGFWSKVGTRSVPPLYLAREFAGGRGGVSRTANERMKVTTVYTRRRGARPFGIALAALVAMGAALTGPPTLASASSGDLQLGSSQFGSSGGEQPPLPEIPPPSAAEIRLDEARNFRDIGGYRTTDGRTVRTGLVFRSNKLSSLNETDLAKLTAANLTLDVDLRNASERAEDPDRIPAGGSPTRSPTSSVSNTASRSTSSFPLTLGRALIDGAVKGTSNIGQSIGYPFMVNYRGSDVAFRDLLTAIANNSDGATVYHCSAGKDRTGWGGTAILLTILGVPREFISADFMASNTYLGRDDAVDLSWLDAAYAQVDRLYGGMDTYVREGLGVDQALSTLCAPSFSSKRSSTPGFLLLGPSSVPVRPVVAGARDCVAPLLGGWARGFLAVCDHQVAQELGAQESRLVMDSTLANWSASNREPRGFLPSFRRCPVHCG